MSRTAKKTQPAKTTEAPKPEIAPKAQDPKKAHPEAWAAAKAFAHAKVAELSRHLCACGCGRETKNTFAPGHDAVLASRIAQEQFQAAITGIAITG